MASRPASSRREGGCDEFAYQTNRGAIEVALCHYCSSPPEGERAVANTPSGPKYFCRSDSEHPLESCYRQYCKEVSTAYKDARKTGDKYAKSRIFAVQGLAIAPDLHPIARGHLS